MRLVILFATFIGLVFSASFAQETQLDLEACGEAQVISETVEVDKAEIEFASSSSIAICFSDLDDQMNDAGWERVKGENNIYKSDFYRIVYAQNGQNAMLVIKQSDNAYKVILDF